MRKIYLLFFAILLSVNMYSQVNLYTFTQSNGTYQEISGGTVIMNTTGLTASNSFDSVIYPIPNGSIPFPFMFNNVLYTGLNVSSNGFITFGTTSPTDYNSLPISSSESYAGAVSAWGKDINGAFHSSLESNVSWKVVGNAPNREFVIQYKNVRVSYSVSDTNIYTINFQIRLVEGTNQVKIVYGPNNTVAGTSTNSTAQIGLRGAANTDYLNRTNSTSVNFNSSTAGTSNASTQAFNTNATSVAGMPTNGLTYTFNLPPLCTGTPNVGALNLAYQTICSMSAAQAITVANANVGSQGIVYQWEESDDNGVADAWVNTVGGSGGTTLSYTPPSTLTAQRYYRLKITCYGSNQSVYTAVHRVHVDTSPPPATQFNATNIVENGATIGWTNASGNRRLVVINTSNNFVPRTNLTAVAAYTASANYTGNGEQIIYDGTNATVNVTGLLCNTTYYVRVYEYLRCGTSPSFNMWHATGLDGSFITTPSNSTAVAMPLNNNFTGFTGTNLATVFPGWYERTGETGLNGTTSSWTNSSVFTGTTTAKVNLYGNSRREWIISPLFTVNVAALLKFKAAITNAGSSGADPEKMQGTDDTVEVMISTDACGAVWTSLYTFNAANTVGLTNVLTDYNVLIPTSYIGQNVRIAFKASASVTIDTPDYDFHIGNINIAAAPTCPNVLQVTTEAVTKNSAKITWPAVSPAPANGYDWEIRTSGNAGDPGAVQQGSVAAGILSIDVLNLTPETTYQVYVRSVCTASNKGAWSPMVTFKTLCNYPDLVAPLPVTICGSGTAELTANNTSGTVRWFANETGGIAIHTGATFTTPVLNTTTSYWVNSSSNLVTASGGRTTHGNDATEPINYGLVFNATTPFKLTTVDVYLASSSAGNLVVNLTNNTGVVLQTRTIALPAGGSASNPLLHTVNLNFDVPIGTGYRLIAVSGPSMIRDSSVGGFPYSLGSFGTITNGYITTPTSPTYYYFYNWQVESGCASPRTEVIATVTPAPELTLSETNVVLCEGQSQTVTIASGATNYDLYTITPTTGVTGDATTGWVFNPMVSTVYTLSAKQTTGALCAKDILINVRVNTVPVLNTNINTVNACVNEIVAITSTTSGLNKNVTFGEGTTTTTNTGVPNPLTTWYGGNKTQMLYLASELTAKGFVPGVRIQSLAFDVVAINPNGICNDFRIKIGNTNLSALTASLQNSANLQTVYNQTFTPTQTGWVTFNFATPFIWDGVSNIIIETAHNSGNGGNGTGTTIRYSATPFVSCSYGLSDSVTPAGVSSFDGITSFGSNGSSINRPNIILGTNEIPTSVWSPADYLYTDAAATIPYVAGTSAANVFLKANTVINAQDYTLTAASQNNCSATKIINVTVNETPAPVISETNYCVTNTLAEIEATFTPEGIVKWYDAATAGTELPLTTPLVNGTTYYAEQIANGCTSLTRTSVTVVVHETLVPTVVNPVQSFCIQNNATLADVIVDGTDVKWYDAASAGNELPISTLLVDGTSYYASQTLNGCESLTRVPVTASIVNTAVPTTTATSQTFCEISLSTLADVEITGTDVKWYDSATSGNLLPNSTLLINGTTYYASQMLDGCESVERLAIDIIVGEITSPSTTNTNQIFCMQTNATLAQINVTGANIKWYDSVIGSSALPQTTVLVNGTTYYATQTVSGCESEARLAVTTQVQNTASATTTNVNQAFCVQEEATLSDLFVSGTDIKWYSAATGGNSLDPYTLLTTGTYYAVQTINGCESPNRLAINVTVTNVTTPTTSSATQSFCVQTNPTVAQLNVNGSNIKWYNSAMGGTELAVTTPLVHGATYYVSQFVNDCESAVRLAVTVNVYNTLEPTTTNPSQVFCNVNNPKLANISIVGTNIKWYSSATGAVELASNTPLVNGTTYYASQTANGCESMDRLAVNVTVYENPLISTNNVVACSGTILNDIVLNGLTFSQLRWYSTPTSTTILGSNTTLASTTYYVSTYSQNLCESARVPVQVNITVIPQPTATAQNVCGSGTVANLAAQGLPNATFNWYNNAQSNTPLALSTPLVTGTYYVEQVVDGCKSTKKPVSVYVVSTTAPTVSPFNLCQGATVANLNLPTGAGESYFWYATATSTTALPVTEVLTSGYYFVERQSGGCISQRTMVNVTINAIPQAPTGNTIQSFVDYAIVSNLILNEPNVIWYASMQDALNGTNSLGPNYALTDGHTYYAVVVSDAGCRSTPLAVDVSITLNTKDLDLAHLKYFPNPVETELNITYVEPIKNVEVFTILGQKVISKSFEANEVKVDLSNLSSGTYVVRIVTDNASQFVKVVKK